MGEKVISREDAARLMRNAAVALAIMPLLDNIDASLNQEWNEETFAKTDEAMDQFATDLEQLGFALVPLTDVEEQLARSKTRLANFEEKMGNVH